MDVQEGKILWREPYMKTLLKMALLGSTFFSWFLSTVIEIWGNNTVTFEIL